MLQKSKAIILRQFKYSETSIIVHAYTLTHGRQSFIINGVRGKKAKWKANLFQPLFLLDMVFYYNEKSKLHRIKELKYSEPLEQIPYQIEKSTIAFFVSELLTVSLREAEPNPSLFDFLYHHILMLDVMSENTSIYPVYFMIHYARFLGFALDYRQKKENIFFDLENACFSETSTKHTLSQQASRQLGILLQLPVNQLKTIIFHKNDRRTLLHAMLKYYTIHLEKFNMKSIAVLEELFNDL